MHPFPDDITVDGELIHWYDTVPGPTEYASDPNPTRFTAPVWMTTSKFGSADPTVVFTAN